LLIVKKPDVIQKNELYFCNEGSNVIQNQLSKSKHRLKSFVLQPCDNQNLPSQHVSRQYVKDLWQYDKSNTSGGQFLTSIAKMRIL
jgi:hypothetical protein